MKRDKETKTEATEDTTPNRRWGTCCCYRSGCCKYSGLNLAESKTKLHGSLPQPNGTSCNLSNILQLNRRSVDLKKNQRKIIASKLYIRTQRALAHGRPFTHTDTPEMPAENDCCDSEITAIAVCALLPAAPVQSDMQNAYARVSRRPVHCWRRTDVCFILFLKDKKMRLNCVACI